MHSTRAHALALLSLFALAACGPGTVSPDAANTDAAPLADVTADAPAPDAPPVDVAPPPPIVDPYDNPANRSPETAITAPNERWTWVPFADSVCGNGQSTGIGVNLTNRSDRVMIFLNGGGACWDQTTCYVFGTAANLAEGYTESAFNSDFGGRPGVPFFDRDDESNPWRDASWVFVPYCTGDAHSGRAVRTYYVNAVRTPTFFVGARNVEVFLRRIVPTFRAASRVWLTGSSAGGFGAAFNWAQVQTAFGSTRVDVIDDSGPPLNVPSRWNTWRNTWNVSVPEGCPECMTRPDAIVGYYAQRYGMGHRFALLSTTRDQTISGFFGIDGMAFETQLNAALDRYATEPSVRFFVVPGTNHTLLPSFTRVTATDGTNLTAWLRAMVTDDPAWRTVRP